MSLVFTVIITTILSYLLIVFTGPVFAAIIAFGIILGCLFRGIYLLNEISENLYKISAKADRLLEKQHINE
ncbi:MULTISPECIES: hypothetical protein [Bacillaceae]|uniref:hypothetical protein n=1 Tax=Bacillaceae TaxID=186817 RepID=UPI002A14B920|nr:hypothetical protein [Cytobacillus sp. IB215316]MDX8362454.1 hypothetical protein [Cytobacillus sp. IB215316]